MIHDPTQKIQNTSSDDITGNKEELRDMIIDDSLQNDTLDIDTKAIDKEGEVATFDDLLENVELAEIQADQAEAKLQAMQDYIKDLQDGKFDEQSEDNASNNSSTSSLS